MNEAAISAEEQKTSQTIQRYRNSLLRFIRSRVADPLDAEDILQEVFYELTVAYQLLRPIENAGAWLFRVARNRIADLFRKPKAESLSAPIAGEEYALEDLLPSPAAGPEAFYVRKVLAAAIADALEELPDEQRDVFLAHEVERQSFKEISARTGVGLNTLLSRKRYAVLHLRRRLAIIHDEISKG